MNNFLQYVKKILYYTINYNNIYIYYKLIIIVICYYCLLLVKINNGYIFLIENIYLYILNLIIIFLLLFRLFIAHNSYINIYNKINNIYNLLNKIFIFYLITFQINDNDIDDIDEPNTNIILANNFNHYYYLPNNNLPNNIKIDYVNEFRHLLLFYLTYLFTICKVENNNFITNNNINFINYDRFEDFINNKIKNLNLFHHLNINNYQFKLNYIEANIINNIYKVYNNGFINFYNYKYLLKIFKLIQIDSFKVLNSLNQNTILFDLLNYINEILIFINIISLIIYFINFIPDIGIIYIIIISFILLYINHIIYILFQNFKLINNDKIKNQGINVDNILNNLYDELYIFSNIEITNIQI
jgi:hypothetical protein